jgi:hypothetical protein
MKISHGSHPRHQTKARSLTSYLLPFTFILHCSFLIANCSLDSPPDPNVEQPVDDTLNITTLTDAIAENPKSFDVSLFIKMKGSWESFGDTASGDPLGKLYAAIAPLESQGTGKKIKLDFSLVNGSNITDTPYGQPLWARSFKGALQAVIMPPTLLSIGAYSFYRCTGLETIIFSAESPPVISPTALEGVGALILEVPAGSKSAYEAAYSGLITTLATNGATITIEASL